MWDIFCFSVLHQGTALLGQEPIEVLASSSKQRCASILDSGTRHFEFLTFDIIVGRAH